MGIPSTKKDYHLSKAKLMQVTKRGRGTQIKYNSNILKISSFTKFILQNEKVKGQALLRLASTRKP